MGCIGRLLDVIMPSIAVLLCSYNGGQFLVPQLESILRQHGVKPVIIVSDDGSIDGTQKVLDSFATRYPYVTWRRGPSQGFVRNFFSLINDASVQSEYYALADQDDYWEPNHLARAIKYLAAVPASTPALYASRTLLVNERGAVIGMSPAHMREPSFRNALINNIASGNTMVFNKAARDLLARLGAHALPVWHDWALYQVVTACGGRVFYDHHPTVQYRQHAGNAIGALWTFGSRWYRLRMLLQGRFRSWNSQNLQALEGVMGHITAENRALLNKFVAIRQCKTPWGRVFGVYCLGLYRQTRLGQIGLYIAALLNLF